MYFHISTSAKTQIINTNDSNKVVTNIVSQIHNFVVITHWQTTVNHHDNRYLVTSTHHGHAWKYSNTKNNDKYLKYHENNNHSASCTLSTVFCIKDVINRRIFVKILLSYQPSITVRVTTFKTPGETDRCPRCHLTDTPILRSIRQKPTARVTVIKGTKLHILTQYVFTHRNSITTTQW